jgi:hypothetical protein
VCPSLIVVFHAGSFIVVPFFRGVAIDVATNVDKPSRCPAAGHPSWAGRFEGLTSNSNAEEYLPFLNTPLFSPDLLEKLRERKFGVL